MKQIVFLAHDPGGYDVVYPTFIEVIVYLFVLVQQEKLIKNIMYRLKMLKIY